MIISSVYDFVRNKLFLNYPNLMISFEIFSCCFSYTLLLLLHYGLATIFTIATRCRQVDTKKTVIRTRVNDAIFLDKSTEH